MAWMDREEQTLRTLKAQDKLTSTDYFIIIIF